MSLQRFILEIPNQDDGKGPGTSETVSIRSKTDVSADTVLEILRGLGLGGWGHDSGVRVMKTTASDPTLEQFVTARVKKLIIAESMGQQFPEESSSDKKSRLKRKDAAETLLKEKLAAIKLLTGE